MLRHLISKQEVANRQNFPKNNYFCYKWRVKDHFNRSIDRQMFHLAVHGADNDKSLMNHKVLQLHKSRFTGNRRDLVVSLAQDAMEFLDQRRMEHSKTSKEQVLYSSAMIDMVDMCFNLLLSCATELNTILGLSELFITATEPSFEVRDKTKETVCSYTQCRFSTSLFSLVMEGRSEKINFYIVPADELISIEEVGLQYESITKWTANLDREGGAIWMNQGLELSDDVLEVCAIQLLSQLIDKTKERLTPLEETENASQEFPLFEEDPWQKDTIGYQNGESKIETATSTGLSSVRAEDQWKNLTNQAPVGLETGSYTLTDLKAVIEDESKDVNADQPEQYRSHNPMELQTLECDIVESSPTSSQIAAKESSTERTEETEKKRISRKKKKQSRRKRKNRSAK